MRVLGTQIDIIAVVSAPLEVQRARVLARTGMTEGESQHASKFMLVLYTLTF